MKMVFSLLLLFTGLSAYAIDNADEMVSVWIEGSGEQLVQLAALKSANGVASDAPQVGYWGPCPRSAWSHKEKPGWQRMRTGNYLDPRYSWHKSKGMIECARFN